MIGVNTKPREGRRRLRIRKERLQQLGRRKFGATTQGALSHAIGIDESNLCNLLSGKRQPSAETIVHLLDLFDVDFEDLFERYEPQPTPTRVAVAA